MGREKRAGGGSKGEGLSGAPFLNSTIPLQIEGAQESIALCLPEGSHVALQTRGFQGAGQSLPFLQKYKCVGIEGPLKGTSHRGSACKPECPSH